MRLTVSLLVAALLAPLWRAQAQSGIGDIVYTVGTVVSNSDGQNWAYILWQATEQNLVSNKAFAVYSKPGAPTNVANYTIQSIVSLQTDARVIEPLVRRAASLGDDTNKLHDDLQALFGNFMPAGSISRAVELSAVIRGSLGDPRYYQNLVLLARNHAAINLSLGFADAEVIPPGITTFEVRAYDISKQQDLAVIGRVTVQAGNPVVLPAPGPPVQVPEASAMGDLNLRFRWGTPDPLRRLGLMQFGYNLYRVLLSYASSNGWNSLNPPPVSELTNLSQTSPWFVRRVNTVPIVPNALFTLSDAANLTPPGDTNTFFIMDDDGRGLPGYVNWNFTNGSQYYYYVAARDVLGRDGVVSPGLLATICDRMPPLPPTHVHVVNDYTYNSGTHTSNQALRVIWRQNPNTNDTVTNYWVYRWTNIDQMNALSGNPSNNLIAIVPQIPGANNSYLDDGSGSPSSLNAYGETYWYSVRAGDAGACGQNLSGNAGPAFGVLRNRNGPGSSVGYVQINCLEPFVSLLGATYQKLTNGSDPTNFDVFLDCTRIDSRFQWAEFYGVATYTLFGAGPPVVTTISNDFGQQYFFGSPQVSSWWRPPHVPPGGSGQYSITLQVGCRAALSNGKVTDYTIATLETFGSALYADVEFEAYTETIPSVLTGAGVTRNSPCNVHDSGGDGTSGTNGIVVYVQPTPNTAEYRIYRRVDQGPLTLMCQGPVTNFLQIIECFENEVPVNGGTLCFYFQLLDINGNPGPLQPILPCVDTTPWTPPPTPVLAKITPLRDTNNPGMTLSWFCAPYGVDRFRVWIATETGTPNTNFLQMSQELASTGLPPTPMMFTNNGTNLLRSFYSYFTPKVGPGFGNNGTFTIPCNIDLDKLYYVSVQAVDKHTNSGDTSNFRSFLWTPTNAVSPTVPWPARGLPSATPNFVTVAAYLSSTNTAPFQWGAPGGAGAYVGATFIGDTRLVNGQTGGKGPPYVPSLSFDPNAGLTTNKYGDSIFPCALYRTQLANTNFPTTSGDAIQVSPLMEKISYQVTSGPSPTTYIQDPFIGVSSLTGAGGYTIFYWIRDTQPQISGALYQYVLVHFKANREIDQLIPANTVYIP